MKDETGDKQGKLIVIEGSKQPKRKGTSRSAMLPNGLTEKQEAFCMAVFEGSGYSQAYRVAYDTENMKNIALNIVISLRSRFCTSAVDRSVCVCMLYRIFTILFLVFHTQNSI